MLRIEKVNGGKISGLNISYYNEIAASYDAILSEDATNEIIRAKVAARVNSLFKGGSILDFGGGTGQDLRWLLQKHYRVVFCEPSAAMRKIAVERLKSEHAGGDITFLDDNESDFRKWDPIFPFKRKVNAILANFAVVNCIPDIELLFEKLALVIEPGGVMVALLLDAGLIKRLRANLKDTIKSFFFLNPVSFFVDYKGKRQIVYLHSTRSIKRAITNNFELRHSERFHGFGFCLIHLVRI
jgi:SAM-dependent methyltransferase